MKKIYLIKFYDNEDDTTGEICASANELPHAATYDEKYKEVKSAIEKWLEMIYDGDEADPMKFADVADQLVGLGSANYDCYNLYVDETNLY